jgi:hypothetical protein
MTPQEAGAALAAFEAVARGPAPSSAPKTPVEAKQRLDALTRDPSFRAKLLASDVDAGREFNALTEMVSKEAAPVEMAMLGVLPAGIETVSGNQATTRQMADYANALRAAGLNESCIREALTGAKSSPEIYRAALNRRAERLSDPEWTERLLAGGFAETRSPHE